MSGQADEIALTMIRAYEAEVREYAQIEDKAPKADVQALSSAMVRCGLTVMATGQPIQEDLLLAMTEGVRRRAVQGNRDAVRAAGLPDRHPGDAERDRRHARPGAAALQGRWPGWPRGSLTWPTQICAAGAAAHTDELAHVARGLEHRPSALLNVILAGPGPDGGPTGAGQPADEITPASARRGQVPLQMITGERRMSCPSPSQPQG